MHKAFEVHMLNNIGKQKANDLARWFDTLLSGIESDVCYGCDPRLLAIVTTKLEEACFFAKKAMASLPENCT
jgi:hypothetical protein